MDLHRIAPGTSVDLSAIDPRHAAGFDGTKQESLVPFAAARARLAALQDVLYAQNRHRLLVVLQAMDTGGKDGTIRHVFGDIDPIGVRVQAFKVPTAAELAHDFLWRVHPHVPGDGEVVVFNRSHYEDVLVARVHGLAPAEVIDRRYEHIRNFERMLVDEGTTIVKFFLHISKDEQADRLRARLEQPDKTWKFSAGDLEERALWDDYQDAYAVAIEQTTTDECPWYVVPADRKWYRNLTIARVLVDTLERLDMSYPDPEEGLDDIEIV